MVSSIIVITFVIVNGYKIKVNTYKEDTKIASKVIEISKKNVAIDVTWQIEIPSINLKADISEGTSKEVLNSYVGHFESTSKLNGNIGLAAHNRGYPVNYFENIKLLNLGDEIIYKYNDSTIIYKIISKSIIEDTDWSLLQETEDNRITLITCVENDPSHRRCIQAVESQ